MMPAIVMHPTVRRCFTVLFFLSPAWAAWGDVGAFEGFGGFAWGSTVQQVQTNAPGTFLESLSPNPEEWNEGGLSAYSGYKMGPQTRVLRYTESNGGLTEYVFTKGELTMVIQTPDTQMMFRPTRFIRSLQETYNDVTTLSATTEIPLPKELGVVDGVNEVCTTFTWTNGEGQVRLACKTWPPNDLRQVYRVFYFSKARSDTHEALLKAWREEQRRIEQERLRQEAEARRIAEEQQRAETAAPATP